MSDDAPIKGISIPPWAYALMLGIPIAGGGGSMLGAQQATSDVSRLEEKVDELDDKIDDLMLAIARVHSDVDFK